MLSVNGGLAEQTVALALAYLSTAVPMCPPAVIFTNRKLRWLYFEVGKQLLFSIVVSEIRYFLPILSRRLWGLERSRKFPTGQSVRNRLSNPCLNGGMIPGNPYRINQVSWPLRQLIGSPLASKEPRVGGREGEPKGPERHARSCKVRAYLRPAHTPFPPPNLSFSGFETQVETFVTSRHPTAYRVGTMTWPTSQVRTGLGLSTKAQMKKERIVPLVAKWTLFSCTIQGMMQHERYGLERDMASLVL